MKKVLNQSIDELIEAESLLKTSDDPEINWEANTCDIIETLKENEKAESEEEKEDPPNDYSMDTVTSSFPTALNHVIYLKQFLINTLLMWYKTYRKWKVNLRKNLLCSNKEQPKHQSQNFWTVLVKMFLLYLKTFICKNLVLFF